MTSPKHNLRDHIADYLVKVFAEARRPLGLEQHDLLRSALDDVLFVRDGLGATMGKICVYSNPDWQEKRDQGEALALDEIHNMAVQAYYKQVAE